MRGPANDGEGASQQQEGPVGHRVSAIYTYKSQTFDREMKSECIQSQPRFGRVQRRPRVSEKTSFQIRFNFIHCSGCALEIFASAKFILSLQAS